MKNQNATSPTSTAYADALIAERFYSAFWKKVYTAHLKGSKKS